MRGRHCPGRTLESGHVPVLVSHAQGQTRGTDRDADGKPPRGGLARTCRATTKGLCELQAGPSRQRGQLPVHRGHNGATAAASSVPRGLCPAPALRPPVQPRPQRAVRPTRPQVCTCSRGLGTCPIALRSVSQLGRSGRACGVAVVRGPKPQQGSPSVSDGHRRCVTWTCPSLSPP